MSSDPDFSSVKWVWWDLDDTLWDFRANSLEALAEVYEAYGLSRLFPTVDAWRDSYHRFNRQLWTQYNANAIGMDHLRMERFRLPFVEAGAPDAEARRLSSEMDMDYLRRLGVKTRMVDGAREILDYLARKGYRMGILSNGFTDVQHLKLESSRIGGYFSEVVLSDAVGINKPDARIFRHARNLAGVSPSECIMVGDNPDTDIAGALADGWHTLLFDPDGSHTEAPCRIESLSSVAEYL